jgi:hypothetical protein
MGTERLGKEIENVAIGRIVRPVRIAFKNGGNGMFLANLFDKPFKTRRMCRR